MNRSEVKTPTSRPDSQAIRQLKEQVRKANDRLEKWETSAKRVESYGSKFKVGTEDIAAIRALIVKMNKKLELLDIHSNQQHRRLQEIERHLKIDKKSREEAKARAQKQMEEHLKGEARFNEISKEKSRKQKSKQK